MAEKQDVTKEQENPDASSSPTNDEELDELLNSALDDFDKAPAKAPAVPQSKDSAENAEGTKDKGAQEDLLDANWSEDFIKEAAAQFEQNMQSLLSQSGINLDASEGVSPDQLGTNFQKIAEAAAKAISEESSDGDFSAAISQTLKNLSEGAENLQTPFSEEELMGMFGGMGLGDASAEGADMMPFMQQMMQSLLSKEILYPALKDIVDKYPEWLEQNRQTLDAAQLERYSKQKTLMTQVCAELETETESDTADVKKLRFDTILDLMQKMQDCGQPPKDLVGDLGSIVSFDEQGNPQLPGLSSGMDPSQCVVM